MSAAIVRRSRLPRLATALAVALLALAGAAPQAGAETFYVNVQGQRWMPDDVSIATGDTITWSFGKALEDHTLTSLDTGANWGPNAINEYKSCEDGNDDSSRRFDKPGDYRYQCQLHEGMEGVIRVGAGGGGGSKGSSTQGLNARGCPFLVVPGSPADTSAPAQPQPAPIVSGGDAVSGTGATAIANSSPSLITLGARSPRVRRLAVRGGSSRISLRYRLEPSGPTRLERRFARRGPRRVEVSFRSLRTRRVVRTVQIGPARVGRNSVSIRRTRALRAGRYRVALIAFGEDGPGTRLSADLRLRRIRR